MFHKKSVRELLCTLPLLGLTLLASPVNAAQEKASLKSALDQEGFAIFQPTITGLIGCFKPTGENAEALPWGKLLFKMDRDLDCDDTGGNCAGDLTFFDKAGKPMKTVAYNALPNNLASGVGMVVYGEEGKQPAAIAITRFKPDPTEERFQAFETIEWVSLQPPVVKKVIFERCAE